MSKDVYIYGLKDPRDGLIYYVGKTINPRGRFKNHLDGDCNANKTAWIQDLAIRGLKPEMLILATATQKTWPALERKWIRDGLEMGWPLTNATSGGESSYLYRDTVILEQYIALDMLFDFHQLSASHRKAIMVESAKIVAPYLHQIIQQWKTGPADRAIQRQGINAVESYVKTAILTLREGDELPKVPVDA